MRPEADLYPFESRYLPVKGGRLHYLDEGVGEPVVCLHGNPTWSFYYRDVVKDLRTDYRVVAPDHIGCGLSDKPGDRDYDYTLDRRVDDVETLLEHLGLRENLTLVLHDWGGMIGMAFAARHPERVRRLVLLNTAAFLLPAGKRLPRSLWWVRKTPLGAGLVRGLNAFSRGAARYCVTSPMAPAVRAGYLAPYDSWANRIAVLRFVQDIPLRCEDRAYETVRRVQDGLERFRGTPTLICWGERDFVFDGDFLAQWRLRLPTAEYHTFANAGHYVLEDAGAQIRPLIRGFLERHPLAAAAS
jgi:haloalkane dehalogenase